MKIQPEMVVLFVNSSTYKHLNYFTQCYLNTFLLLFSACWVNSGPKEQLPFAWNPISQLEETVFPASLANLGFLFSFSFFFICLVKPHQVLFG